MVMIAGSNATARVLATAIVRRGGLLTIASHQRDVARQLAHDLQCRHIQFEALYTAPHDILVVCDDESGDRKAQRQGETSGIHTGYSDAE